MPRISVYPDWVREKCPPGHSVKKSGNNYYLYETKSVYVPGKKNPQPKSRYVGVITPQGIQYSERRVINTQEHPQWYEYGLSRCIYDLCYKTVMKEFKAAEVTEAVVLNIIRHLSPRSYLLKDKQVIKPQQLHVCICNQIKKIEERQKISFEELMILKDIHLLEIDGKKIITASNEQQMKIAEKLGVNIYD